jgi:hypothetical protein
MVIHVLLGLSLVGGCQAASVPSTNRSPAPPAPAPLAASAVHAAAVDNLVGIWMGEALDTPFGDFGFAITFDREPGGDVHGRLQQNPKTYLDFRFQRRGDAWVLVEEGSLTGEVQTHTLLPVAGAAARWSVGTPEYLTVELAVDQESLVWTTVLSGSQHAKFDMKRARGEVAEKVREAIARSRE